MDFPPLAFWDILTSRMYKLINQAGLLKKLMKLEGNVPLPGFSKLNGVSMGILTKFSTSNVFFFFFWFSLSQCEDKHLICKLCWMF